MNAQLLLPCQVSFFGAVQGFTDSREPTDSLVSFIQWPVQYPFLSHCYKNQKHLADQSSLLILLSLTLTTIIVGTTVGIIEFHGAMTYWQYFNHTLKISLIIEILGCFFIALTAIAALSKF